MQVTLEKFNFELIFRFTNMLNHVCGLASVHQLCGSGVSFHIIYADL